MLFRLLLGLFFNVWYRGWIGKQKPSRCSSNDSSCWTKQLLVGHKGLDPSIQAKRYIRFSSPSEFTPTCKFTVRFRPHLYLPAPFPRAIFKVLIQMQYHIVTVTPPRQTSSTFMFKQTRATTFPPRPRKSFREKVETSEFEVESEASEKMRIAGHIPPWQKKKHTRGRVTRAV